METNFRKEDYSVSPITYADCKEWCLYKHYAHRIPPISYAFGLFRNGELQGVCTYGVPASPSLVKGIFGGGYLDRVFELNRLCVNEGLPKNTLSWFMGQTFKLLPKPLALVSFADSGQNHHGYIYQATNWIYTGLSCAHKEYIVCGAENKHSRHINELNGEKKSIREVLTELGDKVAVGERSRKHRYFYFLGNKREVAEMCSLLAYKQQPYPKGDNIRYDASYQPKVQLTLF